MAELIVGLGERSYPIKIEQGVLDKVGEVLAETKHGNRYAIISDETVFSLYGERLTDSLNKENLDYEIFTFPAGEENKNLQTFAMLLSQLASAKLDRKDCVIAIGGGVTGDLAGFVAASYMRGINFVQIPTTLLSQVDSSVGGKTGVDLPEGKNLAGAFYQPKAVFIDPDVLATLPEDEILGGLAEVIKYGVIWDENFFHFLEKNYSKILALDPEYIKEIIYTSCKIKAEVVARDEREGGLRRILNFGHTIGHAVEAESQFSLIHGLAVSIGMAAAARLSKIKGLIEQSEVDRITDLLVACKMPIEVPAEYSRERIVDYLLVDKKVAAGKVVFVLCDTIGNTVIADDVSNDEVLAVLK